MKSELDTKPVSASKNKIEVTYFYRYPMQDNFSIEKVFDNIILSLPTDIKSRKFQVHFPSKGLLTRVCNIFEAAFRQGNINHITGDIHYTALLLRKKNTILTIHDCGFLYRKHTWLQKILLKFLWYRWPIVRSAVVTTVSEKTKQDIVSFVKCSPGKIRVIGNPVSEKFCASPKIFNKKRPIILQIGAAPNKNLTNLIKAIEEIECELWIVGHLPSEVMSKLKGCNITYRNFTNLTEREIINCYMQSDIVSFISIAEGFGMPIIEANAVGRSVITSKISPMKETASGSAMLVDPLNTRDIKQGFLKIINNDTFREGLITRGLENAKKYHPKIISEEYSKLYRELS